jgi:hypothetical protein
MWRDDERLAAAYHVRREEVLPPASIEKFDGRGGRARNVERMEGGKERGRKASRTFSERFRMTGVALSTKQALGPKRCEQNRHS